MGLFEEWMNSPNEDKHFETVGSEVECMVYGESAAEVAFQYLLEKYMNSEIAYDIIEAAEHITQPKQGQFYHDECTDLELKALHYLASEYDCTYVRR